MNKVLTERFEMRLSKSDVERLDDLRPYLGYAYKADLIRYLIYKEHKRMIRCKGVKDAGKQRPL